MGAALVGGGAADDEGAAEVGDATCEEVSWRKPKAMNKNNIKREAMINERLQSN